MFMMVKDISVWETSAEQTKFMVNSNINKKVMTADKEGENERTKMTGKGKENGTGGKLKNKREGEKGNKHCI